MTRSRLPDVDEVLSRLKDFQRASADYAFRRLYLDSDTTHRFLVADEVGLGKTMVAKGIIAKTLDHLWDSTDRIDVIYICSNAEIARQNVRRLDVFDETVALPSRITMLPRTVQGLKENKVNFIPLTPGTSFELRSAMGRWDERVLLYWLLQRAWDLRGTASMNALQGGVVDHRDFRWQVRAAPEMFEIDEDLAGSFVRAVELRVAHQRDDGEDDIETRFDELCSHFRRPRKTIPNHVRTLRRQVIGELRALLAESCLEALQPDLVILDEFQRFKDLLRPDNDAGELARGLFEYQDAVSKARVLLLSATPYKMYTLSHEAEDDHYRDFLDTLRFLMGGDTSRVESLLESYRGALLRLGESRGEELQEVRDLLEGELRSVMIRTERLAASPDRDGMLVEVPANSGLRLKPRDVRAYLGIQRIASWAEHPDATEYWKSSPYLLSFMDNYKLKTDMEEYLEDARWSAEAQRLVAAAEDVGLPWDDVVRYQDIDPANPRLRALIADTVGSGAWRLLWVPPSLPYYRSGGAYAEPAIGGFTKRLVFGSWVVVPKMLTCLVTYEAERRMIRSLDPDAENTPDARSRRSPLLTFTRSAGRLTGMPVLGLLYPSPTLARLGDPLEFVDQNLTSSELVGRIAERLGPLLQALPIGTTDGPVDEAWYWAGPILLDLARGGTEARGWLEDPELASVWGPEGSTAEEVDTAWAEHVAEAQALLKQELPLMGSQELGRQPSDLTIVLAQLAVAGPANSALRALSRVTGGDVTSDWLRDAAGTIAEGSRSLFNLPEAMALIRGANRAEPYWRRVVEHCLEGNLQAVLDEYAHILRESLGLQDRPAEEVAEEIAAAMYEALTIRAVSLRVDEVQISGRGRVRLNRHTMRGRFAMRFQQEQGDDGESTTAEQVREAFNSPFWPFVLATTSVGQEGLDFHQYCHAVVHWNLPSNPVDLEQREGRVHRYKGHAVRKNVAAAHAAGARRTPDPWEGIFEAALEGRPEGSSDIVPYWVFSDGAGAMIERHAPFLPLSRDLQRLAALRRSLAVYRMVFGQPRQEDLVAYLITRMSRDEIAKALEAAAVDLSPTP